MAEPDIDVRGSRVLVVDDTPANLEVLSLALEDAGYQVMFADAGAVALDLAARFEPALILLDVNMPGMDGFEVCRRLRQHETTRSIPVLFLTVTIGMWLFYVQHQFEDTYWREHEDWAYVDAGLKGSSYLVLPKLLQWVTASIGIHHVHHLNAKIPNYRLQECLDANPRLQQATRLTIWDAIKTLRLSLWHEDSQRLVDFREAKRLATP